MPVPNVGDAYRALAASGLDYRPQTRLTISDQAHVTITYDWDEGADFIQLMIQSDSDVHYRWDASSSDTISANNDLILFADTLYILSVPIKLAKRTKADIFFHLKQVTTASSKFVRVVKI